MMTGRTAPAGRTATGVDVEELRGRDAPLLERASFSLPAAKTLFLPDLQSAGTPVCTIGDAAAEAIDPEVAWEIRGLPLIHTSGPTPRCARRVAHLWLDEINRDL
jgi:hypothetical protein